MQEFRSRSRHRRASNKSQGRLTIGVLFLVGIILLFWFNIRDYQDTEEKKILNAKDYLPAAKEGVVYHKPHYSLSYVEKYEIPEWVAYRLTVDMMNQKKFPRNQDFNPDPHIAEGSAHYHDYKQSGYRRGHLVPSADMSWNKNAMDATFLLSNIAPMREEFNDGIWLELEHNVRDWARRYRNIIVIAGPVFNDTVAFIGKNEVLVPKYFFKTIFTMDNEKPLVIGFLFDQTVNDERRLDHYTVSIDSIEKLTGLELFENMYGDWDTEINLEQNGNIPKDEFEFNEKWYLERIRNLTM